MPQAPTGPAQTEQLALWKSGFGRDYTERNDRELPARQGAWGLIGPTG